MIANYLAFDDWPISLVHLVSWWVLQLQKGPPFDQLQVILLGHYFV